MSQENQGTDSVAMENVPVKRKRGRPRKDENLIRRDPASATPPVIDMLRNQHRRIDQTTDAMVGQVVSGVLEGSFDAGYLLTVKIGNTNTVLKGVVFEPGLSVPISVANDVAPHVKMFKRNEIPLPVVDLPTQVPGSNLQSEQNNERLVKVLRNEVVLPSKISPPHVNQIPRASQLSPSQGQINTMAFSKGEINNAYHVPKTAPHALQPEDSKAKSSPGLLVEGLAGEASGDASHAIQVSSQTAASQTKNRMPTDVMQNDKPGLPTREPESLSVDASQVVQVSTQTSAPQIDKRKSIDLLSNDKSDLPTSEPERVTSDINWVVHVPLQVAASQTNVLPNDKFDLLAREHGLPANASQVVEDSLQGAAFQSEDRKSTNVLPDDKVDLLTREHGSYQYSVIKPEQVVQPELKGEPSATQSLQLEHDRAVEPAELLQENEAAALIRGPVNNTNAPEDSKFIPRTEPSVEKLLGSENFDQLTQVQQHTMISELGAGQHADDAMKGSKIKLNYISASDPPQAVAAQPDNKVTTSLENKASPKDDTPQALAYKLSDEIPSRAESSHLDGGPIADACELTEGHTESEPQTSQPVDTLQRGSPAAQHDLKAVHVASESVLPEEVPKPQLSNPAMSMHNEDGISKDASLQLQMLQIKTTLTAYDTGAEHATAQSILTKEVCEPQISYSALSMQDEDSFSKDAIPSKQSEVLHTGTTLALSLDLGAQPETAQSLLPKEVPEYQTSNSTLPIQNEDSVSVDAVPSVQSQSDPVESMNIDSMDA